MGSATGKRCQIGPPAGTRGTPCRARVRRHERIGVQGIDQLDLGGPAPRRRAADTDGQAQVVRGAEDIRRPGRYPKDQ